MTTKEAIAELEWVVKEAIRLEPYHAEYKKKLRQALQAIKKFENAVHITAYNTEKNDVYVVPKSEDQ